MTHQQTKEQIKEYLSRQFGLPVEQVELMLPSFLTTLGSHMANLEKALAENDLNLIGKAGHTIKGAFLNLGLMECAAIALQIEEDGKQGKSSTNFQKLVEDLRLRVNLCLGEKS